MVHGFDGFVELLDTCGGVGDWPIICGYNHERPRNGVRGHAIDSIEFAASRMVGKVERRAPAVCVLDGGNPVQFADGHAELLDVYKRQGHYHRCSRLQSSEYAAYEFSKGSLKWSAIGIAAQGVDHGGEQ